MKLRWNYMNNKKEGYTAKDSNRRKAINRLKEKFKEENKNED